MSAGDVKEMDRLNVLGARDRERWIVMSATARAISFGINAFLRTIKLKEINILVMGSKKQLDRKRIQELLSIVFGITECFVTNWELCRTEPEIRYYPKIIEFIGYCPYVPTIDLVERVKLVRLALGLSHERLAEILQVDKSSLAAWERHEHKPVNKSRHILKSFFKMMARSSIKE